MKKLRILIADDHPLVRQGLRSVLEAQPGWTVCGEAEDGRSAVKLGRELKPDVFLIDVTMPVLNGLDATRQICRERPNAAILILTMHESDQLHADLMRAGARGCLLKSDSPWQLLAAVEAVASGKQYFTGAVGVATRVAEVPDTESQGGMPTRLSAREREIVQLQSLTITLTGSRLNFSQASAPFRAMTGSYPRFRSAIFKIIALTGSSSTMRIGLRFDKRALPN